MHDRLQRQLELAVRQAALELMLELEQADRAPLGIAPVAAESVVPTYLDRYRKGGRFNQAVAL